MEGETDDRTHGGSHPCLLCVCASQSLPAAVSSGIIHGQLDRLAITWQIGKTRPIGSIGSPSTHGHESGIEIEDESSAHRGGSPKSRARPGARTCTHLCELAQEHKVLGRPWSAGHDTLLNKVIGSKTTDDGGATSVSQPEPKHRRPDIDGATYINENGNHFTSSSTLLLLTNFVKQH
uniref:Uncharacterized protein n=1 Tax=Panagrellus redivivus TaxID=6233 RepID=A0A7E4W9W6_PANRE